MKLTPLAKIILILLVLGASVGGYRFYQKSKTPHVAAGAGSGQNSGTDKNANSNANNDGNSGEATSTSRNQNDATDAQSSQNELQFVTSASKKGWIVRQIDRFNALPTTKTPVFLKSVETREAMQKILAGGLKPALWSPSSVIWADRLGEAYKGNTILDTGDSDSYRTILRSPIVFLTTKSKAKFLRPLLGSPNCWTNIRDLSSGKKKAPYGNFKWAHADPLSANSGMLALALILADYAEKSGQGGSIERVANSGAFVEYLKALERKIVYNAAVEKGSSALVQSFADDTSRYDFIVAYESNALEEVSKNPDLAVIYPSPTANSESAVAVLDGDWLSGAQKAGARDFLKFLSGPQAAKDALQENFRPVRGASLDEKIAQNSGSGFRQSYSAIELPPYAALNAAAFKWRVEIAKKSPN
ncbi:extracellular solute-binding protein [Abditibacterium utsteinense]|uniref:Extracellular solute-binding protein n=1 Tax=Abditibacterium utsteinense TaxID=1960156 RepID=A0A2S8STQ3_9BACT|nr:extracellular solute-binding protein [Abditibacterium utsteinense]PQV64158.1 extracellular solute-binding protein [Abditibacterium utsteinense]